MLENLELVIATFREGTFSSLRSFYDDTFGLEDLAQTLSPGKRCKVISNFISTSAGNEGWFYVTDDGKASSALQG